MKPKTYKCRRFLPLAAIALSLVFSVSAQDFRIVRDGVEYAEMTRGTQAEPVRINLLRLDLKKVRLDVVHALDSAIGLEKTSSIAARHGAFAAINAGFFRLDKSIFAGDATGVLTINGNDCSEPNGNRVALFIRNDAKQTQVDIKHFAMTLSVQIKKQTVKLSGINRQRNDNEIIVFTPVFHYTTLTNPGGVEIIVRNRRIVQILDGKGSSAIPGDGFVISASGNGRAEILKYAKIGSKVEKLTSVALDVGSTYALAEDIVGGVPQLIRNGKIEITWEREKSSRAFAETRHPRTAVAKLRDGKFLMVTVDGRQPGHSAGMNLQELAAFLLEQGAIDAMNLDGGGSTTMFLDGRIVNRPSDKEGERSVGDAVLVFPR